ncbi:MAG: hypothetical protein WCT16_05130 [Candidatus Buchananbacteria bacterium]
MSSLDLVNKTVVIQGRFTNATYAIKGLVTKQLKSLGKLEGMIEVISYVKLHKPSLTLNIDTVIKRTYNYADIYETNSNIVRSIMSQSGPYINRNNKENIYIRLLGECKIMSVNGKTFNKMYGDNIFTWPKEIIAMVTGVRTTNRTIKEVIENRNANQKIGYYNPMYSLEEEFFPNEE